MIPLSRLLRLQWIYVFIGVGYNLVSYLVVIAGGQQLSTTPPQQGGPVMLMYGVFLLAAYFGWLRLYRLFMLWSIFLYGYGGIIVHLINYGKDPSLYSSFIGWILAIGINLYGIGLSVIALLGRFETKNSRGASCA